MDVAVNLLDVDPEEHAARLQARRVGAAVADWCRRAVRGQVPVFRAGWHAAG